MCGKSYVQLYLRVDSAVFLLSWNLFQLGEIKQARALATDITAQGAFLYDLLAKEAENKVSAFTYTYDVFYFDAWYQVCLV
jgi:hypothetical protein